MINAIWRRWMILRIGVGAARAGAVPWTTAAKFYWRTDKRPAAALDNEL